MPGNLVADLGPQPPVNPSPGQLWFNQTAQSLFVLTPDGRWVGALAAAGGGGLSVVSDSLLAADAPDITFSNIPATYKHLQIVTQLRGTNASTTVTLALRFNGDSGANYDLQRLSGQVATAGAAAAFAQNAGQLGGGPAATSPAGSAFAAHILIPNYAGTTFHKQAFATSFDRYDVSSSEAHIYGANWRSTAAITSIALTPSSGNWLAGSRATLYGLS